MTTDLEIAHKNIRLADDNFFPLNKVKLKIYLIQFSNIQLHVFSHLLMIFY